MATPHWPVLPGLFGRADQIDPNVDMNQPELKGQIRALALGEGDPAIQYEGEPFLAVEDPKQLFRDFAKANY